MPDSTDIDPGRLPRAGRRAARRSTQLRRIAERVPAYLVGGVVRDLLLGREGVDLDVAIEGDRRGARRRCPGSSLERDGLLPHRAARAGRREDRRRPDPRRELPAARARCRRSGPPRSPRTSPAGTSRSTRWRSRCAESAELLDPHGGLDDLRAGRLRVLHERSFIDDPTRALRAARYAARFGFELEPETARLLGEADLSTVSEDRIQNELRRIAAEEDPAARAPADRRLGSHAEPRSRRRRSGWPR